MNKVQDVVSVVATSEVGFQDPPLGLVIGEDKTNGFNINGKSLNGQHGQQQQQGAPRKSISGVSTGPMGEWWKDRHYFKVEVPLGEKRISL